MLPVQNNSDLSLNILFLFKPKYHKGVFNIEPFFKKNFKEFLLTVRGPSDWLEPSLGIRDKEALRPRAGPGRFIL
jgi:hypothetical protein